MQIPIPSNVRLRKAICRTDTAPTIKISPRRGPTVTRHSTAESRYEIENDRENDADQDRCPDREENRDVLAAISNVARQPPERQPKSRSNQQHGSNNDKQEPETKKRFSEFSH